MKVSDLPSTNRDFEKFVSDELVIARTIRNNSPLGFLSKDQQLRIQRIREGIHAGKGAQQEVDPNYEQRIRSPNRSKDCRSVSQLVSDQVDTDLRERLHSCHDTIQMERSSVKGDVEDKKILKKEEKFPDLGSVSPYHFVAPLISKELGSRQFLFSTSTTLSEDDEVDIIHEGSVPSRPQQDCRDSSKVARSIKVNKISSTWCKHHMRVNSQDVKPSVLMSDNTKKDKSYRKIHEDKMKQKKLMVFFKFM